LRWVELPLDLFNGSSIGAAILIPPHLDDGRHNVLLCNIAAGWVSSSLVLKTSASGLGITDSIPEEGKGLSNPNITINDRIVPEAYQESEGFEVVYERPRIPQRAINISRTWAQYLDPSIEGLNTSLFNFLAKEHGTQEYMTPPVDETTSILVMLVVNGLARIGWGSKEDVFENIDPTESRDWVTLRVDSSLQGYAYNTLTTAPRIAIAVLTVYCLLVAGHVSYTGITGEISFSPIFSSRRLFSLLLVSDAQSRVMTPTLPSVERTLIRSIHISTVGGPYDHAVRQCISSNCWDTIAEVTALAMNSSPTAALRNTCAGITELHIFKLPVRILVSKDEEGEGEHLELVFGSVDEEKMSERTIKANRTYGTLPKSVIEEGKKDI
ncbi:MAG: hypothetical protein Q9180_007491, partial [Flavoplaca navasiana]